MNFLGYDLFGTGSDASPCAGNPSLAGFVIQNGIYDGVYLSGSPDEFSTFYDSGMKWTEDTLLILIKKLLVAPTLNMARICTKSS
mgnify:CR=1 FL=1